MAKASEGTRPDLRSLPKREKLSEHEMRAARAHVNRHDNWSVEKLSDLLWVTEDLVRNLRGVESVSPE